MILSGTFATILLLAAGFTSDLWLSSQQTYREILAHPFLTGLTDGTLPPQAFRYYLEQDSLYLAAFGKALEELSAKAPKPEWKEILHRHAGEAIAAEKQLHASLLDKGNAAIANSVKTDPVNAAYVRHFSKAVRHGTFGEGLAAMLPCYWIYQEVGKDLVRRGSKNPDYQKWIDNYASDDYAKSVNDVLHMMDELPLDAPTRARAQKLFEQSAKFEYEFWDMAWRHVQGPAPRQRWWKVRR